MQLSLDSLSAQLKGAVSPSYTLYGDEPLLLQEARDQIIAAAKKQGYSERKILPLEAKSDWQELLNDANSMGLFAERRIFDIRLATGKPGKDGGAALQKLIALAGDDLCVLISLPNGDATMRNSVWFKGLLEKSATIKIDKIDRSAMPRWIRSRLQKLGHALQAGEQGEAALALLVDRFEGNLLGAQQELEKLSLLFPGATLGLEQVQDSVLSVARYELPQISLHLWSGQLAHLQRVLDGLEAEGEAAVLAQWRIQEDVRILYQLKLAVQRGQNAAATLKQLRVWGQSAVLFERCIARISLASLRKWVILCAQADATVKGITSPIFPKEGWSAVRTLAVRIAWNLGQGNRSASAR